MALIDDREKFLERLKQAQRWSGLNKGEFMKLLFGKGSESSWDRLTAGNTPSKVRTPEARLQIARLILDKTDVPPEAFDLSEPESGSVDRLRREMRDEMDALKTELLEEIEKALDVPASGRQSPKPAEED